MPAPGDDVAGRIRETGRSIYDALDDLPNCFYDIASLEARLDVLLRGLDLSHLPLRTRAKVAKARVAEALGYPVPPSFKRTSPRFPGQNLDVFVQMSNNLQIWNSELDPVRRYVIVRVDSNNLVTMVRVLTGEALALRDRTGTLTSKFQAKRRTGRSGSKLVSALDTESFRDAFAPLSPVPDAALASLSPTDRPVAGLVLSIAVVAEKLSELEGRELYDPGRIQDRARGVALQKAACEILGLGPYADAGQFPDILCQVIEIKLQTSPTIDLGLVSPDSTAPAQDVGRGLRHCDTRYVIAYASQVDTTLVRVDELVVTTGSDFFSEFQRFEGRVQNRKLQIPLPSDLFKPE